MVRVYYGEHFEKQVKKLIEKQQDKLAQLIVLLKENPFHSKLKTKSLSGRMIGIYSFRLERDFRALFRFLSLGEVPLIEIGNRKDIYR